MPEQSNRFCSQCGASIRADPKFCSACGTPVQKSEIAAEEARKTTPPPTPLEEEGWRYSPDSGWSRSEPTPSPPTPPQPKKSGAPPVSLNLRGCVIVACVLFGVVLLVSIIGRNAGPRASHPTSPVASATSEPSTASDTPATSTSVPSTAQVAETTPAPTEAQQSPAVLAPVATITPEPEATSAPTPTPFKKRVVKLDLQGEKPDKYDRVAMDMIKKMKWSLSGDPTTAAKEDAEQFLSVASGMKNYPSMEIKTLVLMVSGAESFDNSLEIDKQLRASGMSNDKISELSFSNAPDSPFANNPMHAYQNTVDEILGKTFEIYWAKVIGKRPETSVGFLGGQHGIREINDIITKNLNDPESFKFDHLDANPDPSGSAWKVDYYFRAKNAFGAMILDHYYFYMRDGKVVGMKHPKD